MEATSLCIINVTQLAEDIWKTLTLKSSDNLPQFIGNRHPLVVLWPNLLLLAREATNDGDDSCFNAIRTIFNQGEGITVEITDNGKPILNEELQKKIEPQLIPLDSKRGTGIEVSICQEIIRQNKGSISVTSNEQATIYKVILPVEELSYGIG